MEKYQEYLALIISLNTLIDGAIRGFAAALKREGRSEEEINQWLTTFASEATRKAIISEMRALRTV